MRFDVSTWLSRCRVRWNTHPSCAGAQPHLASTGPVYRVGVGAHAHAGSACLRMHLNLRFFSCRSFALHSLGVASRLGGLGSSLPRRPSSHAPQWQRLCAGCGALGSGFGRRLAPGRARQLASRYVSGHKHGMRLPSTRACTWALRSWIGTSSAGREL